MKQCYTGKHLKPDKNSFQQSNGTLGKFYFDSIYLL